MLQLRLSPPYCSQDVARLALIDSCVKEPLGQFLVALILRNSASANVPIGQERERVRKLDGPFRQF